MRTGIRSVAVLLIIVLLAACQLKAPAPAPKPEDTSTDALATAGSPGWEKTWNEWVAEGKKEGKVVVYSTATANMRIVLNEALRDKYGIEVEFVSGKGTELDTKLRTERQAGLYLADIYMAGVTSPVTSLMPAGMLHPVKPTLILPDVLNPKNWWSAKGPVYADKEGQYMVILMLYPHIGISRNTDLVKPDELKSYFDLLDPRWKEKIVMGDLTQASSTMNFVQLTSGFLLEKLGTDYLRKLAQQQPFTVKNERLQAEWVARGKYPIGIGVKSELVAEFQQAGATIQNVMFKEGTYLTAGLGVVTLINRQPHPNATRVFTNWLLSKEGQTVFSKATGKQSAREDVPTDFLPPEEVRDPATNYFNSATEEQYKQRPAIIKMAGEIFGDIMK